MAWSSVFDSFDSLVLHVFDSLIHFVPCVDGHSLFERLCQRPGARLSYLLALFSPSSCILTCSLFQVQGSSLSPEHFALALSIIVARRTQQSMWRRQLMWPELSRRLSITKLKFTKLKLKRCASCSRNNRLLATSTVYQWAPTNRDQRSLPGLISSALV